MDIVVPLGTDFHWRTGAHYPRFFLMQMLLALVAGMTMLHSTTLYAQPSDTDTPHQETIGASDTDADVQVLSPTANPATVPVTAPDHFRKQALPTPPPADSVMASVLCDRRADIRQVAPRRLEPLLG